MNTKRILRTLLTALAMLGVAAPALRAQLEPVAHRSHELINVARQYAADNLPTDAVLVLIGAVGNVEPTPGVRLTINADSGVASAWAYVYHVASQGRWTAVAVVDIPMLGPQVYEMEPPKEIPASLTTALRLDLPFGESGAMAARLKLDPDYLDYREAFPANRPSVASVRDPVAGEDRALPATFPLDAPLWTVEFSGDGDRTMSCWVSARTGETFCARGAAAAADDERTGSAGAVVIPNPALGTATFALPPGCDGAADVGLYDASGRRAPGAVRLERVGAAWRAVVDLSNTTAGSYFVTVNGAGAVARLVVKR